MAQLYGITPGKRRKWFALAALLLALLAALAWRSKSAVPAPKAAGAIQVLSARVAKSEIRARLVANGTVSPLQTVEVRPQVSATITRVHIREGQPVHKGERLFTLDMRTENANLAKARAQLSRDRNDLANALRNLERQRLLLGQEYVAQADYDLAQNLVDGLNSQLAIDQAALDASSVAKGYGEITAPISGRTGAIAVYPGSLVQPAGLALLSIAQIDPIHISFTLPERELAALQQAMQLGPVEVNAELPGAAALQGRLVFMDNTVDMASGAIRLKAEFANPDQRLWPGMFVSVTLAPRVLHDALTVPVQAVQTGPDRQFLYVIGADNKVSVQPVAVRLIQDGYAVIKGVVAGTRIVLEGAQNLRPGSLVAELPAKGGAAKP